MALRANNRLSRLRELPAVNILVAGNAIHRRAVESDPLRSVADDRPVAFEASHRSVRTKELEFRRGMIEGGCFLPRAHVVTMFAGIARSAAGRIPVWIRMTGHAGNGTEVIAGRRGRIAVHWRFVTLHTSGRGVSAVQRESRLDVTRQRERRWFEPVHAVTLFAAISEFCIGELAAMRVFVAIHASVMRHLVECVLAVG